MKSLNLILVAMAFAAVSASAASSLPGGALTDARWQEMKTKALNRPRPVIYDNDADDLIYPFKKGETPSIEKLLAIRTSYLHKYPVSTICYCVHRGAFQQMNQPTKYGELADYVPKGGSRNLIPWLLSQGTDMLKLQIEYAHKHNMELFAEFRINDTHDMCDTPEDPCEYFSRWKRQHPQYLIGSYDHQPPYATWSSYDFTNKEVRDLFCKVVCEVAENYNVDGIFIDLYRWLGLFKSVGWGAEASDAEREMFSDMLRTIRKNLERIGRDKKHPILFAIRVPESVGYCNAIGFEWEKLMKEGVFDIVFPSGNCHLEPWEYSLKLCRKYGVKCYPSIDMPTFNHLPRLSRHADVSYLGRIAAAFAEGAEGCFYYNLFNEHAVKNYMPKNAAAIRLKDKRYHISEIVAWRATQNLATGEKYNHMPELSPMTPVELPPGNTTEFRLEFGDDLAALRKEGHTPRTTATLLADGGAVEVLINGKKLPFLGTTGDTHCYEVPDAVMHLGVNTIAFRNPAKNSGSTPAVLMKGDQLLKGNLQFPWRRLFTGNRQNPEPEKIVNNAYCFTDNGKGYVNLVYPLDKKIRELTLEFMCKSGECDAPEGAMLRLACGGYVEMISFANGKVSFLLAKKSVSFDTANFHHYKAIMKNGSLLLEADGKMLLKCGKLLDAFAKESELHGVVYPIPRLQNQSLIVGSLADEGKGTSCWKDLAILRPRNNVMLKDFAIDVKLSPLPQPTKVEKWDFTAPAGAKNLTAGKNAYQTHLTICEVECTPGAGSVKVIASNGGMYSVLTVRGNSLVFEDGLPPLMLTAKPGKRTIRIELKDLITSVFVDGKFVEIPAHNVSMALRDEPAYQMLNERNGAVFRHSGIITLKRGGAKIESLKTKVFLNRK